MDVNTMPKQTARLKPLTLTPLTPDEAIKGAMQVAPPDEPKPKRKRGKKKVARRKRAKKKRA